MNKSLMPQHVTIIMDGNGRWAKQRHLPRVAGHKMGIESVRKVVEACGKRGIQVLSLFAFSSENWRRPEEEVKYLMNLFLVALQKEVKKLHKQNVQLRFIGDRSLFDKKLQKTIQQSEEKTANNTGLKLVIAVNYGGRWDITQACQQIAEEIEQKKITSQAISPDLIQSKLSFADLPEPDLFIRTSGEYRISNFMLWQLAYTELYFTDVLWPDFTEETLEKAFDYFASRERRFGYISEQLTENYA